MSGEHFCIDGVPGTGKTTNGEYLASLGFATLDADNFPGLAVWIDNESGLRSIPPAGEPSREWYSHHKYIWDKPLLSQVLSSSSESVFVYGTTSNEEELFDLFKTVFLLTVDESSIDVIIKRLKDRPGKGFGKGSNDVDYMLSWYAGHQERLLKLGAVALDAQLLVPTIAQQILRTTHNLASMLPSQRSGTESLALEDTA